MSTISENTQKRIKDYYFRTTTSQSKNVEPVLKSSWDLFQNNKTERAKDDGNADEKEVDYNGDNKMATESNMSPTTEVEEQVGASEKNKVTEKCLIFEKLIKENDSQELVKRIPEATHEVKKVTL